MRETCLHQDYMCHYYVQSNGLGGILIADAEYPKRVAFCVLAELLGKFTQQIVNRSGDWRTTTSDNAFLKSFPLLPEMLMKSQNPEDCDKITRIHKEIDATKEVLHQTIDSVLERGVKLDNLVQKSDDLSSQSKAFYKSAADTNKCCVMM
jgi:synaptobrevin family protein YKT6